MPGLHRGGLVEEGLDARLVDPGLAAGIGDRAQRVGDGLRQRAVARILEGRDRHDAVAVVPLRDEVRLALADLVQADVGPLGRRGLSCQRQRALQLLGERPSLLGVGQRRRRQPRFAAQQRLPVLEPRADPFAGGDQLRRADAAIAIEVDQVEGAFVEFEAARGTGQRDPALLVEVTEMEEVVGGIDACLIGAARPEESPGVCHGCAGCGKRHAAAGTPPCARASAGPSPASATRE